MHMGAETNRNVLGNDLDAAAHGIAGVPGGVHFGHHLLRRHRVGAMNRGLFNGIPVYFVLLRYISGDPADGDHVAMQLDAKLFQEPHGHGASGDASSGLPGRGPLQGVAHVVEPVFHRARQVGVAGTDASDALVPAFLRWVLHVLHRHGVLPVHPVAILQEHPNGAAQGVAVAHTGLDVSVIPLNLLPAAAPVPALATAQVMGDVLLVQGQVGRHAFHYNHQALSVGLSGREPPYHRVSVSCSGV